MTIEESSLPLEATVRRTIVTLATCLAMLDIASASAQSAADRTLLARLDAAVATGTLPAVPDATDGTARTLQHGLREFAEWERGGSLSLGEQALFRFEQARSRREDWGWPHYLQARLFLAFHQANVPLRASAGAVEGEQHLEAATRHLRAALERDPDLRQARQLLVDLTLPSADRTLRADVREAIAREVSRPDALPGALVVWARHLRAERQYDSALATFNRAGDAGFDPSVLGLERARTLTALGRPRVGRDAYWEGVARLTEAGRQALRQDLGYILTTDSLASFDAVAPADVEAWLRRFWGERDAAVARDPGERLMEHLRRWVYVFERYRLPAPWRIEFFTRIDYAFDDIRAPCLGSASDFYKSLPVDPVALPNDPRAEEALLDHRGLIYLKHGEPFTRITPPLSSELEPERDLDTAVGNAETTAGQEGARLISSVARSETWIYWVEGGWRNLNFRGSDALGHHAATTLSSHLSILNPYGWEGLALRLPEYRAAANTLLNYRGKMPRHCLTGVGEAIAHQRADAKVGIATDSDTPAIEEPWNATLRLFGLGDARDRSGRALVTFAIPTDQVLGEPVADGRQLWWLDFRLTAYRVSDGMRVDLDTARTFVAPSAPANGQLTGWFELPLEPGTWQVAVRVKQRGNAAGGAYALRRGLVVDGTPELALSDAVTGREGASPWLAPDGPFPVNALGTWPVGGEVDLWFEVRGLDAGDSYRTTMTVRPTEGRRGRDVTITTDDRASGSITRVRKLLGLQRLEAGEYELTVTVEADGQRATRSQRILVVEAP
ncbi:MAG: hypothetical protein R3B35_06065 [Gemmatimonadales bacterium]